MVKLGLGFLPKARSLIDRETVGWFPNEPLGDVLVSSGGLTFKFKLTFKFVV